MTPLFSSTFYDESSNLAHSRMCRTAVHVGARVWYAWRQINALHRRPSNFARRARQPILMSAINQWFCGARSKPSRWLRVWQYVQHAPALVANIQLCAVIKLTHTTCDDDGNSQLPPRRKPIHIGFKAWRNCASTATRF